MRSRSAAFVLVLAGFACNAIRAAPSSPAPVNTCGGPAGLDCSAFAGHADGGVLCESIGVNGATNACQVNESAPYVLVVNVPSLASNGGGSTYAINAEQLQTDPILTPCATLAPDVPPTDVCYKLATPSDGLGEYFISADLAIQAGRNVGNSAGDLVSLPVSVTYWPRWTIPGTTTAIDARLLNLPLPPIVADVGPGVAEGNSSTGTLIGITSPGSLGSPIEWIAPLPPSQSDPGYLGVVEVLAPFDDGYPDLHYPIFTGASGRMATGVSASLVIDITGATPRPLTTITPFPGPTLTVKRADGTPLPAGWTVYYRDPVTLQALTSRATLDGKTTSVRLNEMPVIQPVPPPPNADLVILPPAGSTGSPSLIDASGLALSSQLETYPVLPPVVHVSGTVVAPDGTSPVSASLLFYSYALDDVATCRLAADAPGASAGNLFYQANVETTDDGTFRVDLPQGSYSVIVDPSATSGYAKVTDSLTHVRMKNPPACAGASPFLNDVTLHAGSMVTVTGSAVTADGRPLASASVDFTPAAHLALNRYAYAAEASWPRPFSTTTGLAGEFTIEVDPYGEYDMTVRPQDGSGFPWVVRADHVVNPVADGGAVDGSTTNGGVSGGALVLEPVAIPAPLFVSVTLHDASDTPVSGATVQAYAFHDGVAVLIGDAIADAEGHFTMMLTTAFPLN